MLPLILRLSIAFLTFIAGINASAGWTAYRIKLTMRNEVLKSTNEFHHALARHDAQALDRMLPPDFIITRIDRSVISKAEWLAFT